MQKLQQRKTAFASTILLIALSACVDQPFTVDVPLRVVSVTPGGGALNVARDVTIEAAFSEALDPASVNAETVSLTIVREGTDSPATSAVRYSEERFAVILDPPDLLQPSTEYKVTLKTGIKRARDQSPLPIEVVSTFRTVDPPPLFLDGSLPGDGAIGVARGAPFVLTFSEGLQRSSNDAELLSGPISIEDVTSLADPYDRSTNGAPIAGSISFNEPDGNTDAEGAGTDNVLTFTPTDALPFATVVRIVLNNDLVSDRVSSAGGQLLEPRVVVFEVEHPAPLRVLSTVPSSGSVVNPINSAITVTFSEPVDCASVSGLVPAFDASDPLDPSGAVTGAIDPPCAAGMSTLTFVPNPILGHAREVRATVTTTLAAATVQEVNPAADPTLSHLPEEVVIRFATVEAQALAIQRVAPGDGSTGVVTDTNIQAFFSEDLDCASVTTDNLRLHDLTNASTIDLCPVLSDLCSTPAPTISDGDRVQLIDTDSSGGYDAIRCDPQPSLIPGGSATDLAYSAQVRVVLATGPGGLTSLGGSQIPIPPSPFATTFQVVDRPPLLVMAARPSDSQQDVSTDAEVLVRFDRGVDPATVDDASFTFQQIDSLGGSVMATVAGTRTATTTVVANDTIRLTPAAELTPDAFYRYTLATTICEPRLPTETGGCLLLTFASDFQVRRRSDLSVVSTDPAHGTAGVSLAGPSLLFGHPVQVLFNLAIDPTSLAGTSGTPSARGIQLIKGDALTSNRAIPLVDVAGRCPGAQCPCDPADTVTGVYCVSSDGRTVSFYPDPNTDTVDPGGPDEDIDWRGSQSYNIYTTTAVTDQAGGSSLATPDIRRFVTQISGLVQSAVLDPPGSVLGDIVLALAVPLDPRLTDNLTNADGAFHVDVVDQFGNVVPLDVQVCFEEAGVNTCSGTTHSCTFTDGASTCTGVRIQPQLDTLDCADGQRPLAYDTIYRVYTSAALRSDDLSVTNARSQPIELTTGSAPGVVSVLATNDVTTCDLMAGTCDRSQGEGDRVPVNTRFRVTFADDMLASSFVAATTPANDPNTNDTDTVLLTNVASGCSVAVDTSYDPAVRTLEITLDPAGGGTCPFGVVDDVVCGMAVPAADLTSLQFDQSYLLTIRGRSQRNPTPGADPCPSAGTYLEACASDGRYLDGNVSFAFRTSSGNTVAIRPEGIDTAYSCNAFAPATFSREVDLDSVDQTTFVLQVGPVPGPPSPMTTPHSGLYTKPLNAPDVVTFIPLPATCGTSQQSIQVTVLPGVRDLLGNPFPTDTCAQYTVTSSAAVSCPQPDSFVPGSSGLRGGHERLSLCFAADPDSRVLESSLDSSTLTVTDLGTGQVMDVDYSVLFPELPTRGDRIVVTPKEYFLAARRYQVRLADFGAASLYNQPWVPSLCPFAGNTITVVGDTTRPSLLSVTTDGSPASALTTVAVTFDDAIDPETVVASDGTPTGYFEVVGPSPATTVVAGSYRFESTHGPAVLDLLPACGTAGTATVANPIAHDRVVFTPAAPLAAGSYAVRLRDMADGIICGPFNTTSPRQPGAVAPALTDTAGNCLSCGGNCDTTFVVESTAPTVTTAAPTGAGVSETAFVTLTFSEAMDVSLPAPAILETTVSASTPACGGFAVSACLSYTSGASVCTDPNNCDGAVLTPVAPFGWPEEMGNVSVDLDAAQVTDLAQNAINKTGSTPPIPFTFSTGDFGPQVLCTVPDHEATCDGSEGFLAGSDITLTLDQSVNNLDVVARLEDVTDGQIVPFAVSGTGPTYTITPNDEGSGGLEAGNCYELTIGPDLFDGSTMMGRPAYLRFRAN